MPPTIGAVYYTDGHAPQGILSVCYDQLRVALGGLPLVKVGLAGAETVAPMDLTYQGERGHVALFEQILMGLKTLDTDWAFLVEHDVLYHPSHFTLAVDQRSQERYYYNVNTWKVNTETGQAVSYFTEQTSGLAAYRPMLVEHYERKVARVRAEGFSREIGYEPGTHRRRGRIDNRWACPWSSAEPNVDLRHGMNFTISRWQQMDFKDHRNVMYWADADVYSIPGWPDLPDLLAAIGAPRC